MHPLLLSISFDMVKHNFFPLNLHPNDFLKLNHRQPV